VNDAAWTLLGLAGVLAVSNWVAVARAAKRLEYATKPGAIALLVLVAVALDPVFGDTRAWFVAALVLCLLGDVLLMLPADRFVFGLVSFLLAHVAYTIGLDLHAGTAAALVVASVVVSVAIVALAVPILGRIRAGDQRELAGPVAAYMLVISAMLVSALATGNVWAGTGAALFFVSDALIAWNRFVRPLAFAPVAIMVTYHLGQAGLVLSLAFT
jgi:uncharacterized membrane protein YhhN